MSTPTPDPNAPLVAFNDLKDKEAAWEDRLSRKSATSHPFGFCAESRIAGNGAFRTDAAPTLDEIEGSVDPDSFE